MSKLTGAHIKAVQTGGLALVPNSKPTGNQTAEAVGRRHYGEWKCRHGTAPSNLQAIQVIEIAKLVQS